MQVRQRQNGYCHPVTFDFKQELQYFLAINLFTTT